ncbi:alcohol dehydrogenase-like 3 [Phoenix dactylifera]|uniref:Alcohol dehydrogenase-like 3 n=1 Tax=Phoenix dactylifera TaxID=42345 RepID=A0A8B9A493_PHODC|nr:alcohol dehydrogenase-like 3 [Phoenix dactylifera]
MVMASIALTIGSPMFSKPMRPPAKSSLVKLRLVWGPEEPLVIEEVQVEPPQKMEVRIKILFTSICHTDLGAWKGLNEMQRVYPRILGHEAAGVVESVGEGVEDLKEGDHVVPIFNGECGKCTHCESPMTNLCARFRVDPFKSTMAGDGRTRFSVINRAGERRPIYHFLNTSTFTEFTVLDSACVVKVNPMAPLRRMCLLSCGISTGVGAVWNTANLKEGSTVAVFGLGAVGLAVAEGARLRGASEVIGVDINLEKFVKGREMGITKFINPKDCDKPVNEVIREMTNGGVDYSFECAGNLDVLREAFLSTHDGWGFTVILGIHPIPRLLPLHPMELFDGRRITGSVFGDFKGKSQLPDFVDKYMNGEIKINLDGFITHELPFADINKALQLLSEGKSLRCLLHL